MCPRPRYVSPLRYPGGKARMSSALATMFASQISALDVEVWVEPFAGGAGAGLTMLTLGEVGEVWLNEKNQALAALWRAIVLHGEEFAALVKSATPDMTLWHHSRELIASHQEGETFDDLALGFAALVLNRCSRSGIVTAKVGPIGGKHQNGTHTVASRFHPERLSERVLRVHDLSPRIRLWEGDAIEYIADLQESGVEDEVFLFVDPPYIREGNRLYAHGMSAHDHERLAHVLNAATSRWLLTYDNEPTVSEVLYPERRILTYDIAVSANRKHVATEYAVLSDNLYVPETTALLPTGETRWLRDRYELVSA